MSEGLRNRSSEEEAVIQEFSKELTRSGSGGGVDLHFDADFASEFRLDAETELTVEVVERDGDVAFQVSGVPAGFDYDDLVPYADTRGWERTDEYVDPDRDEWFLTYRGADGEVTIEIDSESQINGNVANNVVIRGDPVDVTGDFERYQTICVLAQRRDFDLVIDDSEGLWQRLRSHPKGDTDDAPDRETFEQLSDRAATITARLIDERSSINTTLAEIGQTVREMADAYDEIDG